MSQDQDENMFNEDSDDPEYSEEEYGFEYGYGVRIEGSEGVFLYTRSQQRAQPSVPAVEINQLLSIETRESLSKIFGNEIYKPLKFVRTEHEEMQKKNLPKERIAHQLRSYVTENPHMKHSIHMRRKSSKDSIKIDSTNEKLSPNLSESPSSTENPSFLHLHHTLTYREQVGKISNAQLLKLHETFMPFQDNKHCEVVHNLDFSLYCGGFNSSGTQFFVAGQCEAIQLYDTKNWTAGEELPVRDMRWTITDALFTPNDRYVLYSSITDIVRMVSTDYSHDGKEEHFDLSKPDNTNTRHRQPYYFYRHGFGIWSLDINAAGTEIVAGTSSNSVVLYDVTTKKSLAHVEGHKDDVNAITFVDGPLHAHVFVSGSDDGLIKLWDSRVLNPKHPKPQGVFPGHIDGLTHLSSRDDGYYFLSNSKDQTTKLWDLRKCLSAEDYTALPTYEKPYNWDYRHQSYPGRNRLPQSHPNDQSVMTYRGHEICATLIRCYFSPLHSTAQKYVYTGSADGRVYVYDIISGDLVEIFTMNPKGITRDVRWHPYEPTIVSPDFYGKLCIWQRQGQE